MPFSQQTPTFKFLLDENVRRGLYEYLMQRGIDVKLTAKGASDQMLLSISKQEKRILITNDEDFAESTKDEVYAVIWLRIPQGNEQALLKSFDELLKELKTFESKLIVLYGARWDEVPLYEEIKV